MAFIVPEGHWAIREYCGKFEELLEPGLHFYFPCISTTKSLSWGDIANKRGFLIEKSEQQTNTPTRHCQTKDNVTIAANTSIGWRIIDPIKAAYSVDLLPSAISDIALNALRAQLGTLSFEEVFSSKQILNETLQNELGDTFQNWGVELLRIEIQELTYSKEVEKAMMKQMVAERERKALIYLADGESESTLMKAKAQAKAEEIEAESKANIMKINAEAQASVLIVSAQAQAQALKIQALSEREYLRTLKLEVNEYHAASILSEAKNLKSMEIITNNPSHKIFLSPEVKGQVTTNIH